MGIFGLALVSVSWKLLYNFSNLRQIILRSLNASIVVVLIFIVPLVVGYHIMQSDISNHAHAIHTDKEIVSYTGK